MSASNQLLGRPKTQFLFASLAAALSMGVSHQALAASGCSTSAAAGVLVDCSGAGALLDYNVGPQVFNGSTNPSILVRITDAVATETDLTNNANITGTLTPGAAGAPATTNRIYGIQASKATGVEEFTLTNNGSISVTHQGLGIAAGVAGLADDFESLKVNNNGLISVNRDSNFVAVTNNAAGVVTAKTTANSLNVSGTLQVGAAIFNDEEDLAHEVITNFEGGTISASGPLTAGIYGRANSLEITNYGTISATGVDSAAIATYAGRARDDFPEDNPTTRAIVYAKTFVDNYGTINGNIIVSENTASQVMAALGGGYDPNIGVGTATDRRDSEIFNDGTINGKIYLGAGSHTLTNTENGTISGDVIVDQRRVGFTAQTSTLPLVYGVATRASAGDDDDDDDDDNAAPTSPLFNSYAELASVNPDHHFVFDNAGVMNGNLTVFTYAGGTSTPSTVQLYTHITGSGDGSSAAAPSTHSGYIGQTLAIGTGTYPNITQSTVAATTTLTPVIDSTVRNGEAFLVASHLFGTQLPTVAEDSFLVDWTAYQVGGAVSNNALAILASVKDASEVAGISSSAASALNGLIAAGGNDKTLGALGGAVESLSDEGDVRKAAAQLAPETNFATQQAAIALNNAVGQHIEMRLNAVGATGETQPSASGPYGLGMKQPSDPNRSNLGGGLKDDPDFVAPRSAALWGQAFGAGLNQDGREQVDGYDARIYGAIAGYDNWISPGVRVGIAGGYANTRIDGEGDTSPNHTEIDSYLVEAYGAVRNSGWYASARTGFTWHDYDTSRVMSVPYSDTAKGSHDGGQFNASIEIGAPMRHADTVITPVASLTYSRLHQNGYSESSDGGMALSINSQDNDSLVSGLGLKALVPIANDTVVQGRALWLHEFADDAQIVDASFAAGGGTFTAAGPAVGRDTADLGLGMLAQISANSTFELNYDANVRQDYLAHIGSARIDVHF